MSDLSKAEIHAIQLEFPDLPMDAVMAMATEQVEAGAKVATVTEATMSQNDAAISGFFEAVYANCTKNTLNDNSAPSSPLSDTFDEQTASIFVQTLLADLLHAIVDSELFNIDKSDASGLMTCVYKSLLDETHLKEAFDEVAQAYKQMLAGVHRGVLVASSCPVRICVVTDAVHWVFVRCCVQFVNDTRTIVLQPSRVFEFDNNIPAPHGNNAVQLSAKTREFLQTFWGAVRFNHAQITAGVFLDKPEKRFLFERVVLGERVRVVDIIRTSTRAVIVRARLCGAVDVAAPGVASVGDAAVTEVAAVIKVCANKSSERATLIKLEELRIPNLVPRVKDCALNDIDRMLVMEDCGIALEYFRLRDDNVCARIKTLLDCQIAVTLNAMHEAQLAFIDLHPGNVIVVPSNKADENGVAALKLIDFESLLPFDADESQKEASPVRKVNGQVSLVARETIDATFDQERFACLHRWVDHKGKVRFSGCWVEDWKSKWPHK